MAIASNAAERKSPGRAGQFAKKLLVQAGTFISLAIVCFALWVVYRTLKKIELAEVLENFQALPWTSVLLALGITAASYVVVTGYDVVALNHINRPLSYPRAALAGFLASAFGSNLGFAMVTGGAIRYRLYSQGGLSAVEIAGITTMCALTVTLGIGFILTLSLLFGSAEATAFSLPLGVKRTLGAVMLGLMVVYLIVSAIRPMTIRTRNWSLRLPSAKTASAQIALGALDLMLIGAVIYVLLPVYPGTDFFGFLGVFALALLAGGVSHVPGGIGVFESVMLVGLPEIPPAALLGAILLFRCVYYLAPLGVAAIMLAAHEAVAQRAQWVRARESATDWLGSARTANHGRSHHLRRDDAAFLERRPGAGRTPRLAKRGGAASAGGGFPRARGRRRDRARDPSARLVAPSQHGLSFDRRSARAGDRGLSSQRLDL